MSSLRDLIWRAMRQPIFQKIGARLGRSRGRLRKISGFFPMPPAPHAPDFTHWEQHELAVAWLGHATMLIRVGGRTILTDPVFSCRVGPGFGPWVLGPRRLVKPAIALRQLPRLDLILLSHAHFDHLDRPTLHRLPKHVPVIVSEYNSDLVRDLGFASVTELPWEQEVEISGLRVKSWRVAHWGARTVYDRHRGYASFVIDAPAMASLPARRVLYGGDSAYQEYFRALSPVDLAIVGIGAYDPWIESHADPEQAWAMSQHAQATWVAPMHHSTFVLSREPTEEPMQRLLKAAGEQSHRVVIHAVGQQWHLPRADPHREAHVTRHASPHRLSDGEYHPAHAGVAR